MIPRGLQVTGLDLTYEGLAVLRDISFALEPGEHLAVLGPSGCGKSTLLRLITGLDRPDCGQIFWQGEDVTGQTGRFPLMGQQDLLLPWKTLWENAGLPLFLRGLSRSVVRERALERLELFGLRAFADYFPHQLSGGMRQRGALARTSLAARDDQGGELLLLDEPFAALDVLGRSQLQEWLAGVLEREQATLVLVTHSVDEALLLTNRVAVLSPAPGRIVVQEAVPYAALPFAEKAWLPEFLDQKRRLLETLLGGRFDGPVRQ